MRLCGSNPICFGANALRESVRVEQVQKFYTTFYIQFIASFCPFASSILPARWSPYTWMSGNVHNNLSGSLFYTASYRISFKVLTIK